MPKPETHTLTIADVQVVRNERAIQNLSDLFAMPGFADLQSILHEVREYVARGTLGGPELPTERESCAAAGKWQFCDEFLDGPDDIDSQNLIAQVKAILAEIKELDTSKEGA